MELIDTTSLFRDAMNIIGTADDLLAKLDDIPKDTEAKVHTYEAIRTVIEIQSEAIRRLVEQHAQIVDNLNSIIPNVK